MKLYILSFFHIIRSDDVTMTNDWIIKIGIILGIRIERNVCIRIHITVSLKNLTFCFNDHCASMISSFQRSCYEKIFAVWPMMSALSCPVMGSTIFIDTLARTTLASHFAWLIVWTVDSGQCECHCRCQWLAVACWLTVKGWPVDSSRNVTSSNRPDWTVGSRFYDTYQPFFWKIKSSVIFWLTSILNLR